MMDTTLSSKTDVNENLFIKDLGKDKCITKRIQLH